MTMIVLNEKEYAQDLIKNKTLGEKPFYSLTVLAKYYYNCLGYKNKQIAETLMDFMDKYYSRYECNKQSWDDNIRKIARNVRSYHMHQIDGVYITKSELDKIHSLNNGNYEKLAFTLICLAKLNNLKSGKNNGWVNTDIKTVFSMAKVTCSVKDRYKKIGYLKEMGMIEFPKRNDNLNCRVTFISDNSNSDEEDENVLFVSDFRELGYEYLKFKGEKFTRCGECGRLIKNNKYGNRKYCRECTAYNSPKQKTIVCTDCGKEFVVSAYNNKTQRCEDCQRIYRSIYQKDLMRNRRDNGAC